MSDAYEALGPLIERFTSSVCPTCERVCCIDRHGTHEPEDEAVIALLGEALPPEPPREDDTLPCRHISEKGCLLPRRLRPFRCTWYFCPALLEAIPRENPRAYRRLVEALGDLVELRRRLLEGMGA
jgi:hypothetical protein